ncbi:thiol-disulfide oxidoreductase DCC family protein [Leadbetterella sp. DM7]|uniref:thiol-disulfide oxidoreductase DCC family protein n=1 Tax=Leadbetterella sp. DM7 TaxID=3235085 RepID=UPI00349EE901
MPVLFFDGECVFCNTVAHKIAERNPAGNIHFASLQGSYAKKMLDPSLLTAGTLVYLDGDRYLTRSEAAFELLRHLPAWRWLRIFRFVPRRMADGLYNRVAENRIRWFGRQESCRVPPPGLRERFITD